LVDDNDALDGVDAALVGRLLFNDEDALIDDDNGRPVNDAFDGVLDALRLPFNGSIPLLPLLPRDGDELVLDSDDDDAEVPYDDDE
jgi:hypothetical protein